jgi:hypothetical protein
VDPVVFPELPTYQFTPNLIGVLSLLLNVVLPLVAALLMRSSWSTGQKGLVLLALAAVKAIAEAALVASVENLPFNLVSTLYSVAIMFGIAVVSHFGIWRGTDVQQAAIASGPVKDGNRRTVDGTYRS